MSKAIIILALLGLATQVTLAVDCGAITCGNSGISCVEVCEDTDGCEWDEQGRSDINMPCKSPDSVFEASCCVSDTDSPTPAPTCPDLSGATDPCYGLGEQCCKASTACKYSTSDFCQDEGGPECCGVITDEPTEEPTESPTEEPTDEPTERPTPSPTCPDNSGLADPCSGLSEQCCPTDDGTCQFRETAYCQREGGPECCYLVTPSPTDEPTDEPTEEPTESPTEEPTDEPTPKPSKGPSDEPTPSPSDEPTPKPSKGPSDEPTPSPSDEPTPTPTKKPSNTPTPEPTTSTTAAADEPETTSTPEPTSKNSWPTKRPTMHSAQKWEMIHPAYKGNDGELLWHVYYGDFSNDERFDEFRDNQLWDAEELRPIIQTDAVFAKYQTGDALLADSNGSVSSKRSSSHSFGWFIIVALILIGGFAYWYKYKGGKDTLCGGAETQSLLHERPVNSYDYQPVH